MQDVTDLMNKYRECSRNLWNVHFGGLENTCQLEERYENIRKLLFETLVTDQLEEDEEPYPDNNPLSAPLLMVVPISSVPILIRRPSEWNWYWDQETGLLVNRDDIQLRFSDYYDYSKYPVKDFHFYLCGVLKFPSRVEYEGRDALVEVADARIYHQPASSLASSRSDITT